MVVMTLSGFNMRSNEGIQIAGIHHASAAYKAGLRKYDRIYSINNHSVEDDLDFSFYTACEESLISFGRQGQNRTVLLERRPGEFLDVDFNLPEVKQCRNRCIFCFIDQLPPGLRKKLYVKDEDLRHSFLSGNYITLTSFSQKDIRRVVTLGLSPLYISVHATDPAVRKAMLRNRFAGHIMSQLKFLEQHGIAFHTQVVVCPGINDGTILRKTISDLLSLKDGVLSVAVVPVGLTKYQPNDLTPVSRKKAEEICSFVQRVSDKDKEKGGVRRLFCADEFFVKAALPVPSTRYYEKYPQIENGVGLLRLLLEEGRTAKKTVADQPIALQGRKTKRLCVLTSTSAKPYIQKVCNGFKPHIAHTIVVRSVNNTFFGESVTVAGLLTAHDIIRTINAMREQWDAFILPQIVFNYRGITLDGYSLARIKSMTGVSIKVVSNVTQLLSALRGNYRGKQ